MLVVREGQQPLDGHIWLLLQMHQRNNSSYKARGEMIYYRIYTFQTTPCVYGSVCPHNWNASSSIPVSVQSLIQLPYGTGCLLITICLNEILKSWQLHIDTHPLDSNVCCCIWFDHQPFVIDEWWAGTRVNYNPGIKRRTNSIRHDPCSFNIWIHH